ncbi:RsmD family RNA methyltransferase [Paenibacillus oenotherae]|uniref:RsmD family RNA methyltransferase n=2 Tax=Paenibacillus oenotherae TaxID=1435645 RepID=A0ABS7D831_9BACL|nr:RsmD family RNA methyltransferase [Paenibacillus oenotherae]
MNQETSLQASVSEKLSREYLYAVAYHEDEAELCAMELRALFGSIAEGGCLISDRDVGLGRSPFIRYKLAIRAQGADVASIAEYAAGIGLNKATFKVCFIDTDGSVSYEDKRAAERQIGRSIQGQAEMRTPERLFGVAYAHGKWLFGEYRKSEPEWLKHNEKPRPYSTALSTRVARAIVNIAVPQPEGVRVIDPCCGIGTVVIEATAMGIDIAGADINPLAVRGARINLAHFGMPDVVRLADMRTLTGRYDTAIIDLPYNLCSKMSVEERLSMLQSGARLADRLLIVTTEAVDASIGQAGLQILDRCIVRKGRFERQILLCRSGEQGGA